MRVARGSTLRIGCVKYLNARPLIWGWPGPVDFDHPSALCHKLARGDLDVALVSSLECLTRPIYRIVDGVSISARGSVHSVIVAHRVPLEELESIELDRASRTSVALLQLLLREKRLAPQILPAKTPCPAHSGAKLLIGDQAIKFRLQHGDSFSYWDLAQSWTQTTSLPFVFALWLIRPEVKGASGIAEKLRKLVRENLGKIDQLAAAQEKVPPDFCRRYYRENLCFELTDLEKRGLIEFHRRCLAGSFEVVRELKLKFV